MSALFTPASLGGLQLANRIVVAPMCQYSAQDGEATDWHLIHLGQLAISGAGLLIIEATAVSPEGRITPVDLGLYSEATEAALRRVLAGVRKYSDIPIGIQLAHAGRKGSSQAPWDGGALMAPEQGGWQTVGPSPIAHAEGERPPAELDPAGLAETAARKALTSADPKEIPAGKYTVILEPAAVLDLVGFMFWDFGGLAILDQRSFLTNRVGEKIFGENINIFDDVRHPLQSGNPFDGEGVPRQRVQLVDRGIARQLVYARGTAEKMRKSEHAGRVGEILPTGHGFPLPNEMGEAPMNIVVEDASGAPAKSIDQMVAGTERGVLVTRLWYIREVDPYEKILTGMTRDGTFYIEDGKLRYGVLNFRFNESLLHMLSSVEEMGVPVRASGEESFDMVVPAMKVKGFNFTEVTKF